MQRILRLAGGRLCALDREMSWYPLEIAGKGNLGNVFIQTLVNLLK